ncbi:MAG: ABC transporter substrate-binding protein [Acidobacteria bacterium]|nr:ABC transporter substrate-binding protein [Acidobacteriota bacterium]
MMRPAFCSLKVTVLVLAGIALAGCSGSKNSCMTLHVVLPAGPTSRDPLLAFDEASQLVFGNVLQTITGDPLGVRPTSGVIAHWTNPDSSTWVLHIRKGLRFHDGRPVTAEDVVGSLERVRSEPSSPLKAFLENVVDVRVQSEDTLVIVASGAVNMLAQLAFIPVVPGGAPVPPDAVPMGSGAYRVVSWTQHRIVLEYARSEPLTRSAPGRVDFLIIPEVKGQESAARTLRPVIFIGPREPVVEKAAVLGLKEVEVDTLASLYLVCNMRAGAPLASLDARRALAAAVFERLPVPPSGRHWQPADDIVPRGVFGRVAGRFKVLAGWGGESAVPRAPLRFLCIDTLAPVGEQLASRLREGGWRIELVTLSPQQAIKALGRGGFDLAILGYSCTSGSALELFQFGFASRSDQGSGSNFSGYRSPRLESILEEASSSLDPAVQHDLLVKAGDEILADLPWIPLFDVTRAYLVSPGVVLPEGSDRGIDLSQVRIGP